MRCSALRAAARPRCSTSSPACSRRPRAASCFDGRDVTELSPEARNIAQVFQFPVDLRHDDGRRQSRLSAAQPQGAEGRGRRAGSTRCSRCIDLATRPTARRSGLTADQKQKISLGRGLVRSDVNAILFDEPLTVIDPHMKWQLRSQLKQLHRQFGYTMVYVTHDQTEALTFADKVVVMYDGEIVQIGTPEELFERPQPHLRRLFHRLAGHERPARARSTATTPWSRRPARSRCRRARGRAPAPSTELGIRPEFVRLGRGRACRSRSRKVEDIGRQKIVRAELGRAADRRRRCRRTTQIPADAARHLRSGGASTSTPIPGACGAEG